MKKFFVLCLLLGSVLLSGCPAKTETKNDDRIPEIPPSTRGSDNTPSRAPGAPK